MRNCSMKFSALEKGLSPVKARQLQKIHGKNSSNTTVKNNTLLLPNMLTEISVTDLEVENGLVVPAISISKDQN